MTDWSLVMTEFVGKWTDLRDAAPGIFGREGLDVFSLALCGDRHLPAEIADGLSADEAIRMVAELHAIGAYGRALPTVNVVNVRRRAVEVWPTRMAGGFAFNEIDGMILMGSGLNVRENLEQIRSWGKFTTRWSYERGANHMHADMSAPDREHVRQEVSLARDLEAALSKAYPAKRFTLSHIPRYAVSFWQTVDEGPDPDLLHADPKADRVWCQPCERSQRYEPREIPDPDFPQAEWGRCAVCGEDVLVRARELTWEIGPV